MKYLFWVNYPFKRTVKQQAAIRAIFHINYKLSADMLFASPLCKHASMLCMVTWGDSDPVQGAGWAWGGRLWGL